MIFHIEECPCQLWFHPTQLTGAILLKHFDKIAFNAHSEGLSGEPFSSPFLPSPEHATVLYRAVYQKRP